MNRRSFFKTIAGFSVAIGLFSRANPVDATPLRIEDHPQGKDGWFVLNPNARFNKGEGRVASSKDYIFLLDANGNAALARPKRAGLYWDSENAYQDKDKSRATHIAHSYGLPRSGD